MQSYKIYIDSLAYKGESLEETEEDSTGALGNTYYQGSLSTLIIGQGEPIVIYGLINLKSHLDRITRRMRVGTLRAKQIIIDIEE